MSSFRVRFEPVKCLSPARQERFQDNSFEQPIAPRRRPKSKLGCRECKARRVKCDETFPVCLRCVRRGLICSSTHRLAQWQIETRWYSSHVDTIVNRRLLQYWLERVCQILVIDPEDNPFSFPVLEYLQESPALVHIIQSVSARHEQYFSAEVTRIALEERGKALVSFRKELGIGQTRPLLSMLTALLLALSHGADRDMTDFGKWHLFAARTLINKMLEDTSPPWDLNPIFRLCLGMYLYWDMGCSYLVHPDEQQDLDTPNLSLAVQQIGHWHHPMYGFCTDLIFILGNLGRYCRQLLSSGRRSFAREALLEKQLYLWGAPSTEPTLTLLYESLRKHGLILLYRTCGWNDAFINPCLEEVGLEPLVHRYALATIDHLLQIPASSNYLNFQSIPLLTAGSELKREDNKMRDDVRHRLRALFSVNRLPVNLHVLELLEEIWAARDIGNDKSSWIHHMLRKGWLLVLG
ncbi:fungal-specific transcription factor domain-containing protein [Aspergillus pseudotamarii]|uniref:Fungal-specific transcription factor domain-containing protein n=1 Tax=Aspergillus pseudotamarii TaxID=132259 RepID=A0A5N6SS45_ASPPS|nr:fungal-specific transcription factor domain-containing protein [Aspergillus pseudotamarii]KAE8136611.1 fungal-specific transcription factor domain-containing protein [Aspergillus pseudotamarii]